MLSETRAKGSYGGEARVSIVITDKLQIDRLLAFRDTDILYILNLVGFRMKGEATLHYKPEDENVIRAVLEGRYQHEIHHEYGAAVKQRRPPSAKETFLIGGIDFKTLYTKAFREVKKLRRAKEEPATEPSTEPPTERELEVAEIYRMHASA